MKKYAVIVAGGSGQRMGAEQPKQFLPLAGRPILMHTVARFHTFDPTIVLIVVLPAADRATWEDLCARHQFAVPLRVTSGGPTRSDSVRNGLALIEDDHSLVAIHDGVRPLVTATQLAQSYAVAADRGCAIAAVPLKDSIRRVQGTHTTAADRAAFRLVQTPQTFRTADIKAAYAAVGAGSYTDDATVAEQFGLPIFLTDGSYSNLKITTPEDLLVAEALLGAEARL